MERFFIIFLLLVGTFLYSQPANKDLGSLITLTVDSDAISAIRALALYEMLDIEKEGFLKDYDSLSNEYYKDFERYYEEKYTGEEIKALHNFYQSNVGKKVSGDLKQLFKDNFPVSKTLERRLQTLKNGSKIDVHATETVTLLNLNNVSFEYYLTLIGVRQYLDIVQEYEVMRIEPQYENKYRENFALMTVEYLKDIYDYVHAVYTQTDVEAIKEFYYTSLGKKVVANAGAFAAVSHTAYQEWIEGYMALRSNLTFGKYQRD